MSVFDLDVKRLLVLLIGLPSVSLSQPQDLDCGSLGGLEPQSSVCECSQIQDDNLSRLQCFDDMAETLNLRRLALDELIRRILERPEGIEAMRAAIRERDE